MIAFPLGWDQCLFMENRSLMEIIKDLKEQHTHTHQAHTWLFSSRHFFWGGDLVVSKGK